MAVDCKADASPVTIADQQAEEVMRALIKQAFPTHGIFGEEHGLSLGQGEGERYMWVLDPIDGTKSFITGVCWGRAGAAGAAAWRPAAGSLAHQALPQQPLAALSSIISKVANPLLLITSPPPPHTHRRPCRQAAVRHAHRAASGRLAGARHHRPADCGRTLGRADRPADLVQRRARAGQAEHAET